MCQSEVGPELLKSRTAELLPIWYHPEFIEFGLLSLSLFCFFLGLHLKHMEVLWLGVKLQLQLQLLANATATLDLSRISDLCTTCRMPDA